MEAQEMTQKPTAQRELTTEELLRHVILRSLEQQKLDVAMKGVELLLQVERKI